MHRQSLILLQSLSKWTGLIIFSAALGLAAPVQAEQSSAQVDAETKSQRLAPTKVGARINLPIIEHRIRARFNPARHQLHVIDSLRVAKDKDPASVYFRLHAGLKPRCLDKGCDLRIAKENALSQGATKQFVINDSGQVSVATQRYRLTLPSGADQVRVEYSGRIFHPLKQGEEYARSFSETPGTIEKQGLYLAGSSYWLPSFDDALLRFDMELNLPKKWDAVSQGERTAHQIKDGARLVRWVENHPQDEVYLSAGPLTEYSAQATDKVKVYAFLRSADDALANKYLRATGQYIQMYQDLIGPYPYAKFALVENFWQTGYGMPSFTLLGPKVIRFPFILRSSYPHEILHNWWGNSVFVDAETGNWCEGLTAYLADHLMKEQDGKGEEYRRAQLQAYADYVVAGRDFPLSQFRARHSAATQAVGYGKTLMVLHMLRRELGDRAFKQGLRDFYRDNKFRHASFTDLQQALSAASKKDLSSYFAQWVQHPGAPVLAITDLQRKAKGKRWQITGQLGQIQKDRLYALQVPVVITLKGQAQAELKTVDLSQAKTELSWTFAKKPLRVDVDPSFDLMRRLDAAEIPPSLGGAFGSAQATFVLPRRAKAEQLAAYRAMIKSWRSDPKLRTEQRFDDDKRALPATGAIWVLGWDNALRPRFDALAATWNKPRSPDKNQARIADKIVQASGHSLVVSAKDPHRPRQTWIWLGAKHDALPALARKLPHYGKYSRLAFAGAEANNVEKVIYSAVGSPLSVQLDKKVVPMAGLKKRVPLAELPPAFDSAQMMQDLRWLADPARHGRGFGSPELKASGEWIAKKFAAAGLQPAGDPGQGFFQSFAAKAGDPKIAGHQRQATLRNVVAVLPGSDPNLAGQSVVIGAHYDHLGLGWPDVHKGDSGKIHPGADDNASGVAVLLELARSLPKLLRPQRSIVFVAFSGEEEGLLGSQHYAKTGAAYYPPDVNIHEGPAALAPSRASLDGAPLPGSASPRGHRGPSAKAVGGDLQDLERLPPNKIIGMVNIDTVGRLQGRPLLVLGTNSAREWIHIVRGAGFVTGVKTQSVAKDPGSSDQRSFTEQGIPAVQLFSGPHADYHRPGDSVDKIEVQSLLASTSISKEIVEYLSQSDAQLSSALANSSGHPGYPAGLRGRPQAHPGAAGRRKVSLGTIPDFAYPGPGMRMSGVTPASPAAKAGLQAGDILTQVDDQAITDLRALSQALRRHKAGDKVKLVVTRGTKTIHSSAVLIAR